ncbi:hypothetical protein I8751_20445 [Nostocaceae cyanobacterium CENA357]|uniref:Uncharacterized protein n=1 Tax=Atlanticothrix silvestris CENA357 TaxID=1725252 RepID=A0A8J7HGH9_9CYAN|nr:hypothetical protein [Atlanticothrix silvestris]MBH8554684.1 hypothetical protein [Atlanticothrix silvestris CENA357]
MNHNNFHTIDPTQSHLPDSAVVQKVLSDNDRLPTEQHDKAVRAFFVSDGIASGIGKDLAFVDQIPNFIKEIIDNKLWECLYVAKGVVTPYYCRYTKGSDAENFRAFIAAKRPNGLETSVETIDRVLQADSEVQRKFRAIIYQAQEKERDELGKYKHHPSRLEGGMDDEIGNRQQERLRAANRAAEAIPLIGELLDRSLIAIDVAALLGRDIKDPKNLTAEEREYVDKRDLIGLRINQYIYTNPIPEDEDREPAYSRELNNHIKDILGIKDRSKSVRMDNPKKAAEKLLQFYQGDKLKELIDRLKQALEPLPQLPEAVREQSNHKNKSTFFENQLTISNNGLTTEQAEPSKEDTPTSPASETHSPTLKPSEDIDQNSAPADLENWELTPDELAKRLQRKPRSLLEMWYTKPAEFPQWSQKRDPDGIAWERSDRKKGRSWLFIPVLESKQE